MNEYKLNKYRKGNFILKDKHIYAKNELEKIRDSLLNKYTLYGGSITSQPVSIRLSTQDDMNTYINNLDDFLDLTTLETIIKTIKDFFNSDQGKQLLINSDQNEEFKSLIESNSELIKEFEKYRDINNAEYIGLEDPIGVKTKLLKIQKNLVILVIKVLLSKLRKIKKSNMIPLFEGIEKQILYINKFINAQEEILNNTPVQPSEPLKVDVDKQQPSLSSLSDAEKTSIDDAFKNYLTSIGINVQNKASRLNEIVNNDKLIKNFTQKEIKLYDKALDNKSIAKNNFTINNLETIKKEMKK